MNTSFFSFVFSTLLIFSQINSFESAWKEIPPGECLMILGAKIKNDHTPDTMMKERLETSLQYITPKLKAVILSGGSVDKKKPEAQVMKQWLIEKGVDKRLLIIEEESTSTYENFLFSKSLLLKNDCEAVDIISHRFHLPRVRMVASGLSIDVHRLIPAVQENPDTPRRLEREYEAMLWYFLSGRL